MAGFPLTLFSVLGGLLVFLIAAPRLPHARRVLSANLLLRLGLRAVAAINILVLSSLLCRHWSQGLWGPTWFSALFALGTTVLAVSTLERSRLWGFVFGVSFIAGGGLLPPQRFDIHEVLQILLVGGLAFGGICAASAKLGDTLASTTERKQELEHRKAEVIAMIDRALGENEGYS